MRWSRKLRSQSILRGDVMWRAEGHQLRDVTYCAPAGHLLGYKSDLNR